MKAKNDQLSEYAFINSHIHGAPVARISGLVNLLDKVEEADIDNIKKRMTVPVEELKDVTRQINHAIEEFGVIKRENIKVDDHPKK